MAEPLEVEMLFVIPDIGGYTRFMLAHQHTPAEAQKIITSLMEAMLKEKGVPLRISEVEGDALFLYAVKHDDASWQEEKDEVAETIENFFVAFEAQLEHLARERPCPEGVCVHAVDLTVKIIVHLGRAVLDRLDRFTTINGVDAIITHRLLKNSLKGAYLLVTKPAFEACRFPSPERFERHVETYDDVGTLECFVFQTN